MLNNKSQIKRRARRFFTQRACFSAVADCTSTISGASLFQSRVTTLPATLKTCSDLEDAAGMAKMTLKIGARMDNGLQKIIEKSVYCKVKIPNQNKTLTSALTYCLPRPAPPHPGKRGRCPAPPRPENYPGARIGANVPTSSKVFGSQKLLTSIFSTKGALRRHVTYNNHPNLT